ncbi:mucin-2-like isoform X1 [Sitodiplosis mosellana]|uniref:mucin-2-like isoform X1 n=1 Tax=Sitodiplosis mosellana TaxID=263140 RepID=UPI002444B21A|nr:mucin-2-like isoform X1 [Sitodiplosis mosellana]XP_055317340.1 mucin-2-like isoform X1 [Sitodiplosis mosellana]
MKQLLRLLTALMLFFGLCHIVSAQRRGSTRFISSPDELTEWDSHKMASDSISRADVVFHDNAQSTRRGRYRTKTERPTMSSSSPSPSPSVTVSDDIVADLKTAKVPVYRVRGRNRSYKQYTENEKNLTETTTAKASGESSNRTVRRKSYQSNKQRTITRNENQSIETNQNKQKEAVSSTPYHATQTTSSRKYQTESESKSTTELPSNHQPENHRKTYGDVAATRKSPTGRRYRIRVVDANSINANADTAESEKKAMSLSSTTAADDVKTKAKKPDRDAVDEELNYPEHFKALLKSKKSTAAPYQVGSSRPNNFVSKKQIASSTVVPTEQTSTIRPTYKHKKIERPNLKLLFPSLHTSTGTTTTESTTAASTAIETDQTATDEFNTETNEPSDVTSTTVKIKTTVNKQIGGSKFSSKIRTDGGVSLAAFRPRSTPLVFETLKSTTQRSTGKPDVLTPNHRLSTGPVLDTPKFSARYKSGGDASSLAAYRKNLMREKPPFYTPTTPPITTQVNEIDWAASDYSYHYNDVEPIHSGLMQNPPLNVETSHHSSSSVTVSIFGALSEILSHTTESLSFLTSTTTEYTPLSHTHSTFLSTHDNHTPTQIQKIHSDKPKTPTMTGDSTTTTTNTNIDSNEFQLPILNAFDSNEAITSSKSSNEQVDAKLKTSSYSQFSTQAQNIAFSSTDASNLKSNLSDSINDNDSPVGVIDQMHSHMNHSNSNSGGIMIVLATSDRSSMQSNRTPYAIQHTEQPLKMQINTISEMLLDNSTTQTDATGTEYVSQSSTHRSKTNNDIVIPIYPVYAITTNSPIIHSPSSIDNQSLSTEPSTIDRPQQTTSMPITTTSTTTTTTTTSTKATITATVPTTTTMTIADLNLTETTEEHSLNSVNISLFDLETSYPIVNNDVNLTRLNQMMTFLFNQSPQEWEQTMTNTELTVTDLSTINVENNNEATTTIGIETVTEPIEMPFAILDEPQTILDMNVTEANSVEITTIKPSDGLSSNLDGYVPRFINRIATLPIGFFKPVTLRAVTTVEPIENTNNEMTEEMTEATTLKVNDEETTKAIEMPEITIKKTLNINENTSTPSPSRLIIAESSLPQATPSTTQQSLIYPLTTTEFMSSSEESNQITRSTARKKPRRFDFVVYGILANNTVIRRYPEDIYDDDSDHNGDRQVPIVYGILSNSTVLRKYPNGTTTIDEKRSSRTFEITNIDPISLYDPNSAVYTQMTSSVQDQASNSVVVDSNPNNQMRMHKSTFNSNNLNTTSAIISNNNNANSITAPPTSAEQLGEYLRKANNSKVQTKSENVFSLAPPTLSGVSGFGSKYRPISLDDYDSLPSSNEVTSNESSSTVGNIDSDPFSLSAEHVDNKQPSVPITATSPKSNREYITSFTTTTTTTQKPHIEKGVKIIRELVEQARTTEEPDTNRPIQSLTTTKSIAKEKPVTTHKPKATSAPTVPANHRPTWAMESTSSRLPANHNFDGMDKTEKITENIAKTTYRSTSPRTTSRATTSSGSSTTTTTTRGGNMRSSTTEKMKIASSTVQIPISINDIEDLLQNIPTTTRRVKPTTTTVRPKPTTPAASDNDDLNFLRQVQRLLQRPTSTRMPIQTKSTTSTSAINTNPGTTTTTTTTISSTSSTPKLEIYMLSKNKNENNGPTSTFDDLLNSFQKEPTTTTRRPQLTTFSDADDIAFLKGLRQIAVDTSTTKTTRNPDFAKQIIAQLGLNQTSNTPETPLNADGYPRVPTVNRVEIEKNKKDVASLNTDLQLLSTLLGRPISQKDIPQLLTKQASTQAPTSTTARTTTATKTTVSPKIIQEIELLHQIAKKPDQPAPDNDLTSTDELAAIDPSEAYGKTNDALLATLLKQRGIGPAHNNIPLNIYSTTTTPRPRYQTPSRSPRPLLDGLSWLWKQWQDTAPGQGGYAPQSSRTRTRGANSETAAAAAATATDSGTSFDHFDDGLDSDTSSIPLDQSHTTNGNSGFGFGLPGGGGQLLSAALGVTKLVTNFLGSALQGAGKTFQSAWSTQAFGSAGGGGGGGIGGGGDYFRLSG